MTCASMRSMSPQAAVRAEALTKSFGPIHALAGIDLVVPSGTVYGLLGPNGAGKTTAVRILTTILQPDGGRAEVLGLDVTPSAAGAREHRPGWPVRRCGREPHRPREPAARRAADPPGQRPGRSAGPRPARALRSQRRRQPADPYVLGGHAPPARP